MNLAPSRSIYKAKILNHLWITRIIKHYPQSTRQEWITYVWSNQIFERNFPKWQPFRTSLCSRIKPIINDVEKRKKLSLGKWKIAKYTHNFFFDDLKLFATNRATLIKQLDIVTTFSEDIGVKFGEDKCTYLKIERGKIVQNEESIFSKQLTIKPVGEGDCFRYLGVVKNIEFVGPINNDRILKAYTNRVREIWSPELSDHNKVTAITVLQ